jgi:hypothetical protein
MSDDEMLKLADEAERIANGATEPPWYANDIAGTYLLQAGTDYGAMALDGRGDTDDENEPANVSSEQGRVNMEFCVYARTAVPQLASALRQAVTENRELRQRLFDEVSDGNGLRNLINDQGEEIRRLQARVRELEAEDDVLALLDGALNDMVDCRDKSSGLTATFYGAKAEILRAVIAEITRRRAGSDGEVGT